MKWLTFHDHKWLNFKRPLTGGKLRQQIPVNLLLNVYLKAIKKQQVKSSESSKGLFYRFVKIFLGTNLL